MVVRGYKVIFGFTVKSFVCRKLNSVRGKQIEKMHHIGTNYFKLLYS